MRSTECPSIVCIVFVWFFSYVRVDKAAACVCGRVDRCTENSTSGQGLVVNFYLRERCSCPPLSPPSGSKIFAGTALRRVRAPLHPCIWDKGLTLQQLFWQNSCHCHSFIHVHRYPFIERMTKQFSSVQFVTLLKQNVLRGCRLA